MTHSIAGLRREYSSQSLSESDIEKHPVDQFEKWWQQAIKAEIIEPNAMTLATASADGMPSARIVLLKGVDKNGFVFFSNYKSYKGLQLEENPKACLVFFWNNSSLPSCSISSTCVRKPSRIFCCCAIVCFKVTVRSSF